MRTSCHTLVLRVFSSLTHFYPSPCRALTGVTQLNSSLLIISVIAVLIPAAFHFSAGAEIKDPQEARDILAVSHGVRSYKYEHYVSGR